MVDSKKLIIDWIPVQWHFKLSDKYENLKLSPIKSDQQAGIHRKLLSRETDSLCHVFLLLARATMYSISQWVENRSTIWIGILFFTQQQFFDAVRLRQRHELFHFTVACRVKEKIIPNKTQKPIWIPHESQVAKPQVKSGESKSALSDELGNYSCDFSSA